MALKKSDVKVGDSTTQVVADNLSRTQIVQYAGSSGDYNPLHTDEVFATQVAGASAVFAHGMLTMALTGRAITDWVGEDRLLSFGVRFAGQVWPGDTLVTTLTVTDVRDTDDRPAVDLDIRTTNQDGREVLTGTASAQFDMRG